MLVYLSEGRSVFCMPRDFKFIMSSRFCFTLGVAMQAVMLGWRMYDLTHDPLYLGLVGLVEAIPAIGLALVAGYVVDRSRPLITYRFVVFCSFLSAAVMLTSQMPQLGWTEHQQIMGLFFTAVMTGTARSFSQPSMYALIPRIVDRENLPRSSAWMTTTMQIGRISGPALGGFAFGFLGLTVAELVVCFVLLVGLVVLFFIKTNPLPFAQTGAKKSIREELLIGVNFVFRHPILFPAMSLDMVAVLFGGVTALLPIYASDILRVGPKGLGILRASPAIGAVIVSFMLTRMDIRTNAGRYLFVAVTGFGASILAFSISRDFYFSAICLALSGAFDSVSMVVRTSAVQLASPENMRGRISAVNSIFIGSSNEIGEFESGVTAKLMGVVPSAIFGGVICLLTAATIAMLSPTLRKMNLHKI
jgi:MFS family permease